MKKKSGFRRDYNNGTAEWFLEAHYANKAPEFAKGKTDTNVVNKIKVVETIKLLANAVEKGELVLAISKTAE